MSLATATTDSRAPERFMRRRPVAAFVTLAFGIGWPVVTVPLLAGMPADPFLLVLVFAGLLVPALVVTRITGGPGAIRRLLARATMWRFGAGRWLVILLAVPLLTVALAGVSGTLHAPENGVPTEVGMYLFSTLVFGALILNVWEEMAWGGFVQTRFMARHGLLVGSLLTAPLFAAIHLPLLFAEGWTWADVGAGFAILLVAAPFYRYLLGLHLLRTGGSVLAIGVQHAAWNASGNIDGVDGEWQSIAAVALLTVLLAVLHRRSSPAAASLRSSAEKSAAASWNTPTWAGASPSPMSHWRVAPRTFDRRRRPLGEMPRLSWPAPRPRSSAW